MFAATKKYLLLLCLGLITLTAISWYFSQDHTAKVTFLDVGQGDSILIETPEKRQILIDGGPSDGLVHKLGQVMPFFDRHIDMVILTHPDADHITGLLEVFRRYDVGLVLENKKTPKNTAEYRLWRDTITARNIPNAEPIAGGKNIVEKEVELEWLTPLPGAALPETNDNGLVCIIHFGEISFLFTGDISAEVEEKLLTRFCMDEQNCILSNIDVLKVPHHGSSSSSSIDFINTVHPDYAVIQSGQDNPFGHPQPVILKRLENIGTKVYRNDLQGDIVMKISGHDIIITTKK